MIFLTFSQQDVDRKEIISLEKYHKLLELPFLSRSVTLRRRPWRTTMSALPSPSNCRRRSSLLWLQILHLRPKSASPSSPATSVPASPRCDFLPSPPYPTLTRSSLHSLSPCVCRSRSITILVMHSVEDVSSAIRFQLFKFLPIS
jgi:hypothetical protein